jgi:hypothetical protein
MLGAFKDFGKAAVDLQKKEFYDKSAPQKATIKTKSADGVCFEASSTAGGKETKTELNLNFKDSELELKNKIQQDGTYTVDATVFKIADSIDLKAVFVTPASTGKEAFFKNITVGCDYKTADINASGSLKINLSDTAAFAYEGFEFSKAVAFKAADDLSLGCSVSGLTTAAENAVHIPSLIAGAAFKTGDMSLACTLNGSFKAGDKEYSFQAGKLTALLSHPVTTDTTIAASFAFGKDSDKAGWVNAAGTAGVEVKLGSSYKLSSDATVKSKLTVKGAEQPDLDFAWIQKFGSGSLTLSQSFGGENAFGVSYTLDA